MVSTEEEMLAIMACAIKAQNKYKDEETKKQTEIVRGLVKKWFEQREKNREQARKWNKEHAEQHRKTNLKYYHAHKDKIKEYNKQYYHEVLKEKRKNAK